MILTASDVTDPINLWENDAYGSVNGNPTAFQTNYVPAGAAGTPEAYGFRYASAAL